MGELKTLANCKPSEFLRQTNRIRKAAAEWLTATDILNIRKNKPVLEEIEEGMSDAEKVAIAATNRERLEAQARENVMAMLDAIVDENPEGTLELLALSCFIEPEHVDDYQMSEYFGAITELIEDENVMGFFTSLARLGQTGTRMR